MNFLGFIYFLSYPINWNPCNGEKENNIENFN